MLHRYTPEQVEFLSNNVTGRSNAELTKVFNAHFGLKLSVTQIKTCKSNRGLSSGLDGRFISGSVPANKGTQGLYNVGGNRTSFKKGQTPVNYKPVGSERIDRDGYVLVKVQDEGPWPKRWRHKHKVLWEEVNGPIPKGHCLLFLDGNKLNLLLDNLRLITRGQLARLNQNHLIQKDADLTRTGIIIADIYGEIGKRKKVKK